MKKVWVAAILGMMLLLGACGVKPSAGTEKSAEPEPGSMQNGMQNGMQNSMENDMEDTDTDMKTIYLAGGCFWGMEQLMSSIPGVVDAVSGYANGDSASDATYEAVCTGDTGFRETVKVTYDPARVSLDALLLAYFYVIDPTVAARQGNDVGDQYQTGVYYADEESRETVLRIADVERGRNDSFLVEIGPLVNFYPAEAYHQDYLVKHPNGYCHIPREEMALFSNMQIDPGNYQRPAKDAIREMLTAQQYAVTQESATEVAFSGAYWNTFEKGIYVDAVTGEPLFSSTDKYESGCGWPAFSKPIEEAVLVEKQDTSHGMYRTEVRSRAGDSHLGHVFTGDSESPNGVRYCINSASLRFVPYGEMDAQGYGYLKALVDGTEEGAPVPATAPQPAPATAPRPVPANTPATVGTTAPGPGVRQAIAPADFYGWMTGKTVDYVLVDVRTESEYAAGHIPGAMLLPNEVIAGEAAEKLPDKNAAIVVYCRSGRRSAEAAQKLLDQGYTQVYDLGGIQSWPYETEK